MDNGTIIESLKYLNYCQLAKNSFVSKRFCYLIRTYRHVLALFNVDYIGMSDDSIPLTIKMFDKAYSPEAYNDWFILNHYPKQVSLEGHVAGKQSTQFSGNVFELGAYAAHHRNGKPYAKTTVLYAHAPRNYDNWPLFQRFGRLFGDPFIYIRSLELTFQNVVINFLGRINADRNRLQCKVLTINLNENIQFLIGWIKKNNVRCDELRIFDRRNLYPDKTFLFFLMTGAHCTSKVYVNYYMHSNCVIDLIQKFMDLKSWDECHMVDTIRGNVLYESAEALKRTYSDHIVKDVDRREQIHNDSVEFVNNNIAKKLQLTITKLIKIPISNNFMRVQRSYVSLKIHNL